MSTFSYHNRSISELSEEALICWLIAFLNGSDPNDPQDVKDYEEFMREVPNRSKDFQDKVKYLNSVL